MSQKRESGLSTERSADTLDTPEHQTQSQSQSRRKFIKGAAAATPIILSVASRPVWARNCSLSGQLSGNLSDQDGQTCHGEGCSTDFWMQRANVNLYHPQFPPHMLFVDAFDRDAFPGKTLFDVIQRNVIPGQIAIPFGCSPTGDCKKTLLDLGAEAVAALQNSASSIKFDLDLDTVILSFQKAYDRGTAAAMLDTIIAFNRFNGQHCPLPYAL